MESPIEPRAAAVERRVDVPASDAFDVSASDVSASRPRLRHTVTLGESYAVVADAARPPVAGPSVQVNVTTPVIINNPVGYGYGVSYGYGVGYGYGRSSDGARSVAASRGTSSHGMPTQVGGDFPPPPDYGPRALK